MHFSACYGTITQVILMRDYTEHERCDSLEINGYHIWQNKKLFCFGIDAVLLSSFVKLNKNDSVVDLCSGTGILPFLFLARNQVEKVHAVEINAYMCSLMSRSAKLNNCESGLNIINADLNKLDDKLTSGSFDVVTVNPPYEKAGCGIACSQPEREAARREIFCTLDDVVRVSARLLKHRGRLYIVHRPSRLCDLMCSLRANGLEPRLLKLVYSSIDTKPVLILAEAVKGAGEDLKVDTPIIIYDKDGELTAQVRQMYG